MLNVSFNWDFDFFLLDLFLTKHKTLMKKTTLLFQIFTAGLLFFGINGNAQVGTLCTNPIVITTMPYSTTDNTSNYADNYDPPTATPISCGAGTAGNYYISGNDVIYSYTPTQNATLTLQIPGAVAWTGLFVFTSCAGIGSAPYACNCSSAAGNRTINNMAVTAGQTYYILISSWATPQTIPYTLNITQTLGTEDFSVSAIATFPNPVKDILQVANANQNISDVAVYNLLGQEVIRENWSGKNIASLNMSNLASGTYLLTVTVDGIPQTKKIIKN